MKIKMINTREIERDREMERPLPCKSGGIGRALIVLVCGSLVYYHCAYRQASLVSLVSDVLIVLLCSLAILGLLFRQLNISYVFSFKTVLLSFSHLLILVNVFRIFLMPYDSLIENGHLGSCPVGVYFPFLLKF